MQTWSYDRARPTSQDEGRSDVAAGQDRTGVTEPSSRAWCLLGPGMNETEMEDWVGPDEVDDWRSGVLDAQLRLSLSNLWLRQREMTQLRDDKRGTNAALGSNMYSGSVFRIFNWLFSRYCRWLVVGIVPWCHRWSVLTANPKIQNPTPPVRITELRLDFTWFRGWDFFAPHYSLFIHIPVRSRVTYSKDNLFNLHESVYKT